MSVENVVSAKCEMNSIGTRPCTHMVQNPLNGVNRTTGLRIKISCNRTTAFQRIFCHIITLHNSMQIHTFCFKRYYNVFILIVTSISIDLYKKLSNHIFYLRNSNCFYHNHLFRCHPGHFLDRFMPTEMCISAQYTEVSDTQRQK